MKYLLWAALLYLAWRWFQASQRRGRSTDAEPPEASDPGPASGSAERMVRCSHCGIYLPASEALAAAGSLHYCSESHRDLHQTQRTDSPHSR